MVGLRNHLDETLEPFSLTLSLRTRTIPLYRLARTFVEQDKTCPKRHMKGRTDPAGN